MKIKKYEIKLKNGNKKTEIKTLRIFIRYFHAFVIQRFFYLWVFNRILFFQLLCFTVINSIVNFNNFVTYKKIVLVASIKTP